MKCSNAERNCEWEGTVGTLEEHVAVCEFALVPCPKECKDDSGKIKYFIKEQVEEHLQKDCPNRDYTCEHCGEKGTYTEIIRVHDKECDMKLVSCLNECGAILPRRNTDEHVKSKCEYTVISCNFQNIGCKREMKRGEMAAHEDDDKFHLHMALDAVVKLQATNTKLQEANIEFSCSIAALKEVNDKLEESSQTLKNGGHATIALPDYQKKKMENAAYISPLFYTHPNGYRMALKVYTNGLKAGRGTHVSVYARIMEGKYDSGLKWPFIGTVTFTLLNQLEDKNHYTLTLVIDEARNANVTDDWGFHHFIPHSALAHNAGKNTQYLNDDTLYFKTSVKVADHKPWLECNTN